MQKIQLNKTTKQSNEKKTVLNIIATNKVKEETVPGQTVKCMQELFFSAG